MGADELTTEGRNPERYFGAWWGVGLFAILLVSSVIGNVLGGIVYAVYIATTQGQAAVQSLADGGLSPAGMAVVALTGAVVSAGIFIGISLWRAGHLLRDGSTRGVGWVAATSKTGVMGVLVGILMAGAAIVLLTLVPADLEAMDGPLAVMAQGGYAVQVALILFAVIYAPIVEEYIFRGVLFTAFRRSWGLWPAAVVVTLLFTGLHAADKLDYLPGFAMVFLMGAVALFLRIRYKSLLPAIAMHFVYNLSLLLAEAAGFIPTV